MGMTVMKTKSTASLRAQRSNPVDSIARMLLDRFVASLLAMTIR
jgi:hypothetical protein